MTLPTALCCLLKTYTAGNLAAIPLCILNYPFLAHKRGLHVQPKGRYLRAFCKGDWSNLPGRYLEILSYAKEHDLQFYGFAYEKGINELVIDTLDDYITQIEIPLKIE